MDSNSTHQVAAETAGGSGSTVITIPRWIEVKDRRPGAERFDPSRSRYYVVSPKLGVQDATTLAHAHTQRERLEKAYLTLEQAQTPVLLVTVALLIYFVIQEFSYWTLLIPAVIFIGHQFMYQDAANDLRKPLDVNALEEHAETRMFHRISVNEFQAVNRLAQGSDRKAVEAHQLLWRAYELSALYLRTQDDFQKLTQRGELTAQEVDSIHAKLAALHALVRDAHNALSAALNPRKRALPVGRDALVELIQKVDSALHEGIDMLGPRLDEVNARVAEAKQKREAAGQPTGSSPSSDIMPTAVPQIGRTSSGQPIDSVYKAHEAKIFETAYIPDQSLTGETA
jgi:hypothetical protein